MCSLYPVESDPIVSNESLAECELIVTLLIQRVISMVTCRIGELVLQVPES